MGGHLHSDIATASPCKHDFHKPALRDSHRGRTCVRNQDRPFGLVFLARHRRRRVILDDKLFAHRVADRAEFAGYDCGG